MFSEQIKRGKRTIEVLLRQQVETSDVKMKPDEPDEAETTATVKEAKWPEEEEERETTECCARAHVTEERKLCAVKVGQ